MAEVVPTTFSSFDCPTNMTTIDYDLDFIRNRNIVDEKTGFFSCFINYDFLCYSFAWSLPGSGSNQIHFITLEVQILTHKDKYDQ